MNGIDAGTTILLLVDFLFGVLAGIVGTAARASVHEDRRWSLTGTAPDPSCEGTRVLHGVGVSGVGWQSEVRRGERPADMPARAARPAPDGRPRGDRL